MDVDRTNNDIFVAYPKVAGSAQSTRDIPIERLLLRADEAAEALGISRAKVYEIIASGELPSIRIGKSIRVSKAGLCRWIAEREGGAGEQVTNPPSISPFRRR